MRGSLTLKYEFNPDPNDDFGWLEARVEADGFCGANGFWVQWQDVVEFASSLSQYPLPKGQRVEAEWGYSEGGTYTRVTFISLTASNRGGGIAVCVDLADSYDVRRRCQLVFETSYANLSDFRVGLESLMKRAGESAVLLST